MTTDFVTRADQLESSGTPLRRFWGTFHDYEIKMDSRQEGRYLVDLNFTDIEIVPFPDDHELFPGAKGSVTPYNYPVCQINMRYNKGRSGGVSDRGGWGMFLRSMEEQGFLDLVESKGSRWLMEAEDNHLYGENDAGEEIRGMVWSVVESSTKPTSAADSSNGSSLTEDELKQLLSLIDGKDLSEFSQAALQDPVGRKVQSEIFNNKLVASWISEGLVELEGETYKVIAGK